MTCEGWPLLEEKNVPYYVQIYDIVFQMIQEGELKEGDVLPGENLMASYWNISRATVRMAVRKLEEDGFIYKMQGKRTTVASSISHLDNGLQWLSNPCINSCVAAITRISARAQLQQSGEYVAKQLGYHNKKFVMGTIDTDYFSGEERTASSVCIFHSNMLEMWNLSLDDEEALKEVVTKKIYQASKRSRLSLNVMAAEDNSQEPDGNLAERLTDSEQQGIIVMEEVLIGENSEPIAYCKYWLNANWYRFALDRKSMM